MPSVGTGFSGATVTTAQDIQAHRVGGSWRTLESLALQMVADASSMAKCDFKPVLGGGTRLMLAMNHRISDDIDLFIRDPQWIGYLTPRLNDHFEHLIDTYDEGPTSLKVKLPVGEIDFIVSMSLLGLAHENSDDCLFDLEPVSEVLAKKLFYRGWALTPRDLFDWWCIETQLGHEPVHIQQIAKLVSSRIGGIKSALKQMRASSTAALVWHSIRTPQLPDLQQTVDWAQQRLNDFQAQSVD
jgi:hypothetical protein